MQLKKTGYSIENIAESTGRPIRSIQNLINAIEVNLPEIKRFEVNDPDTEIENLIEYIPQAPPFFKDIAIQRLKQLC